MIFIKTEKSRSRFINPYFSISRNWKIDLKFNTFLRIRII